MIKRLFRIFLFLVTCALLLVVVSQLILKYPKFLFEEELNYRNFIVLSNEEVSAGMTETLDEISSQLLKTGFYEENDQVKVILCSKRSLTTFFDIISLAPVGAGFHHFSGNIYLFPNRIEKFRLENLKLSGEEAKLLEYTYQTFQLDKVLTHEILHKLHSDSIGVWKFKQKMTPPHWKAEGFAEYYTYKPAKEEDENYNFRNRVSLYLENKNKFPLFYYKSQLLYEFLSDHQHLNFVEIMEDDVTEQVAFKQLIKWYNTNKKLNADSRRGKNFITPPKNDIFE